MGWFLLTFLVIAIILFGRSGTGHGVIIASLAGIALFILVPLSIAYVVIGGPMLVFEEFGWFWAILSGVAFWATPLVLMFTDFAPALYKASVIFVYTMVFWFLVFTKR